jgi:cell division protein FtsW
MAIAETTQSTPQARRKASGLPFDMPLVVSVGALVLFGLMMVFSSTFDWSYQSFGSPASVFLRQLGWTGVGIAAMFVAARINYHWWHRIAVLMMIGTIGLLLLVLILGTTVFGAIRSFFGGSVQPSELAKLVTIIYLAVWLASKGEMIRALGYGMLPFGIIVGVVAGLILLQPDLSAAVTIVIIATLMFFIAGADLLQMGLVGAVGAGTVWAIMQLPIQVAQTGRQRLAEYIAGIEDLTQASWHVKQAMVAFVNGGLFGRGLGESHQKFGFLPTPHTDSIFAIIGEELGLFGCLIVIALFIVFAWRGFKVASGARDSLGAALAAGIVCWITFEALVNIAVMVGALPFAGNALPFISYGGSNLVVTLTAVGILLSVARHTGGEPIKRKTRATGLLNQLAQQPTAETDQRNATFDSSRRDGRRRVSRPGRR